VVATCIAAKCDDAILMQEVAESFRRLTSTKMRARTPERHRNAKSWALKKAAVMKRPAMVLSANTT